MSKKNIAPPKVFNHQKKHSANRRRIYYPTLCLCVPSRLIPQLFGNCWNMTRRNRIQYYAVVSGRVDQPTIFSSWGDAHPRVTGCPALHKAFSLIEEARGFMVDQGVSDWTEEIKDAALDTTPECIGMGYYAIANGPCSGIHKEWYGKKGVLNRTQKHPGACFKWFRTRDEAERFIEDWKESFAEDWRMAVREKLDAGFRPLDMKVNAEELLIQTREDCIGDKLAEKFEQTLRLE